MNLGASLARRNTRGDARRLHDRAVAQARSPGLYALMGAPDTVEGRFELLVVHIALLVDRLEVATQRAASQALFDVFVGDLDGALREMGVGDLAVPRRMKALAGAFYGRAKAYRIAFAELPDAAALTALIARTILAGLPADPAPLAAYIADCRDRLAGAAIADILAGEVAWPDVRAS